MQIGAKCPVHRVLEGEVMFEETVELADSVPAARSHIWKRPNGRKPARSYTG